MEKKKKASSFYLACPLQVYLYLELIVGGETVMGGNEGAHGKIRRKEFGTSRQPCAAFLHIPTKLCYFRFPISERTTVRRSQKQ